MEPFLGFLHRLLFGPNKIHCISYRIKMFVLILCSPYITCGQGVYPVHICSTAVTRTMPGTQDISIMSMCGMN